MHSILESSDKLKSRKKTQYFFHFEITMHRVLHKKGKIGCFFCWVHRIFRKREFCKWNFGEKQCQFNFNKLESVYFTLWKCCIQGVLWKEEYHCFLDGLPVFFRINYSYTFNLGRKGKLKPRKKIQEFLHFENAI